MLVLQYLMKTANQFPTKEVLACGSDRHADKHLSSAPYAFSDVTLEQGLEAGANVARVLQNSPDIIMSIFGLSNEGGRLVYIPSASMRSGLDSFS